MILQALGAAAAFEAFDAFFLRRISRSRMYARAERTAIAKGLPLLVVGDPDTGFITKHFGRDYGCGSTCTDLTGCPGCPSGWKGRLEDVLPRVRSRSHVVFVSLTLEYVDDLPRCIRELERVAAPGGLFVLRIPRGSSTFWLFPGAKWVLEACPPGPVWKYRRRRRS